MFKREYDRIIREYFDLSDRTTRQYIATLEDAGQEQLLNALSSALYDKIVTKVDDIDFGTIPMSRGDITKVEGFAGTEECLAIIRRLVLEYKQNPGVVDVVLSAIQNVKDRKAVFIKGYALNVELPMLLYNTIVLAIERSTSLMIATCMEYIKDPNSISPKAALNKVAYNRTMDDVLFKSLISFNNMCAGGGLDKALDAAMKHPVKEDVAMQYGTVTPIDEEQPNDNITNPVTSAITPDNTIEPFGNDPEVPVTPNEPDEYKFPTERDYDDDDITGDADEEYEFPDPETWNDDVDDECGGSCGTVPVNSGDDGCEDGSCDAPVDEDDDVDIDTPISISQDVEEPVENSVDSQNIPSVVPGEDISSTDAPITEKDSQKINEGVIGAIGSAIGALINGVIGLIRNVVYAVFYTQLKLSDYLAVQADLLEANANELRYSSNSNLSDKEKDEVVKKQIKWVQKLRKWSNKFALDSKSSSNKAQRDIDREDRSRRTIGRDEDGDYSIF